MFCVLFLLFIQLSLSYFYTSYQPMPPGANPLAVNKYHIIYHIVSCHIIYHIISYHIISCHIVSYHIISYIMSYHIISKPPHRKRIIGSISLQYTSFKKHIILPSNNSYMAQTIFFSGVQTNIFSALSLLM